MGKPNGTAKAVRLHAVAPNLDTSSNFKVPGSILRIIDVCKGDSMTNGQIFEKLMESGGITVPQKIFDIGRELKIDEGTIAETIRKWRA